MKKEFHNMLEKDKRFGNSINPEHKIVDYINTQFKKLGWNAVDLARNSNLSQGEVSKILTGVRKGLSAKSFYFIYTAFDDTCAKATKTVYPALDLKLNKYKPKERNAFGKFMQQFETSKNSIEEISAKTGIDENRLKDLYYRRGALEAHELLLIEKAVGKKQGELFEEVYG